MSLFPEADKRAAYEREVERGITEMEQGWQRIAVALRSIHDERLYTPYGTWADYCRQRWAKTRRWAYRLIDAANVLANLATHVTPGSHDVPLPTTEAQIRPLAQLGPTDQAEAWSEAVSRHGDPTRQQVAAVVAEYKRPSDGQGAARFFGEDDDVRLAAVADDPAGFADTVNGVIAEHGDAGAEALIGPLTGAVIEAARAPDAPVYHSSQKDEWYSPPEIIAAAASVLGDIELDPASSAGANRAVCAARFFAADQDGLARPWQCGTLYLNPPYSEVARWIEKLVDEYRAANIGEAIALVAARVDTQWWQLLVPFPVCFITGRLRFSAAESGAPFPSAVVYLGRHTERFASVFQSLGPVYTLLRASGSRGER